MNEQEKAILGSQTLSEFLDQFGNDVYSKILLEILIEGLMYDETLFVFGQPEQEGNEADNNSSGRIDSNIEDIRSENLELTPDLGAENSSDHP
jgi:hypothetical protein